MITAFCAVFKDIFFLGQGHMDIFLNFKSSVVFIYIFMFWSTINLELIFHFQEC